MRSIPRQIHQRACGGQLVDLLLLHIPIVTFPHTVITTKICGADRGKTVTKPLVLDGLGLSLSEKQIPQVVENLGSGDKSREALEMVALRVKLSVHSTLLISLAA